jgi:hypothetical protein
MYFHAYLIAGATYNDDSPGPWDVLLQTQYGGYVSRDEDELPDDEDKAMQDLAHKQPSKFLELVALEVSSVLYCRLSLCADQWYLEAIVALLIG